MATIPPPDIFDRTLRRQRRDRAARDFAAHAVLVDLIGDEILDRLDDVSRTFTTALDLGCHDGRLGRRLQARGLDVTFADAGPRFARMAGGVLCDEDRLPFADASFDLIVSAGVLDQVGDLPGALVLARRALKPDGLFLAGFSGAGSLPRLRAAVMTADIAADRAAGTGIGARLHPQIDIRAAGDLLQRAGFALPVADGLGVDLRYGGLAGLVADLRGSAATRLLSGPKPAPILRERLAALEQALMASADPDGRIAERAEIVFMTGWAPAPDQPKPARRGSGRTSLADALRPPGV